MKKITTFSLFVFFAVVTAILTAGLVFYQNNKKSDINNTNTKISNNNTNAISIPTKTTTPVSSGIATLSATEVAKHNTISDCWIIINNKVYDVSGYASQHPGGAQNIANYCGKEATEAFDTKGGRGSPHSGRANNMLANFYMGDLNQK